VKRPVKHLWPQFLVAFLILVGLASFPLLSPGNRLILKAKTGNKDAMFDLGIEYRLISQARVKGNIASSVYWLKRSAEAGRIDAYFELGQMRGLTPEGSIYWYEKGAEKGNSNCMGELAKAYQFGINGVLKDPALSRKWWDRANEIARKNRGYPSQP